MQRLALTERSPEASPPPDARLRALIDANYTFIWRILRRFGVERDAAEDAAQEVFWIAARRLDDIKLGSERAFLYGTAMRVAAEARRVRGRRREDAAAPEELEEAVSSAATPEEALDAQRARALLDEAIAAMPQDVRDVFVLFELESIEIREIAELLKIPIGTVGSRLRRARKEFSSIAARLRARMRFQEKDNVA